MREGNYQTGERHPRAKLTDKEVDLVRDLHDQGEPYAALAKRFGLSKSGIAGIVSCRRRAVVLYAPR